MVSCSLMIPNYLPAMSRRDIGAGGRQPRDSRLPRPVQSVRRNLFGEVDHHQTSLDLQRELQQIEEENRNKYNFDFSSEQPIDSPDSRFEWSQISTHSNITEDKTDLNISTKLCKISDQNIAQSSAQSQSVTSSPPEPKPELISKAVSSVLCSKSSTSATISPDSKPQCSSSGVEPTEKVGQKHKVVKKFKQMPITAFFEDRKSAGSQRKRKATQVLSHKNRETTTKRHRLECTSAVRQDVDTTTDVRTDEDSVRTGTPV